MAQTKFILRGEWTVAGRPVVAYVGKRPRPRLSGQVDPFILEQDRARRFDSAGEALRAAKVGAASGDERWASFRAVAIG